MEAEGRGGSIPVPAAVNYTYEEPRPEQHCMSVWGKDLSCIANKVDDDWNLKPEVRAWLDEHDNLVSSVMVGSTDDFEMCFSFRFKTKDAAMMFKLRFGGSI
jgi:hypothetical protein